MKKERGQYEAYYFLVATLILAMGSIVYMNYDNQIVNSQRPETNYIGLLNLKLIPNTESRVPTENDIDTKIMLVDGEKLFRLYESRSFEKGDYGKMFVVRFS